MHRIDLTTLATVADLQQLIEDAQAEIARREALAREQALSELEALAGQYGKTVDEFLKWQPKATKPAKAPANKAPARKQKTLEEATAGLRRPAEPSEPAANDMTLS